jgi:hypothetical protein
LNILVVCPIYQAYSQSIQSMLLLDWPARYDLLMLQGEPDGEPDGYARVTRKYQEARRQFLSGDYDAMLTIEADMLVPPHALTSLLATGADVAYGLYCWRHAVLGYAWSAYSVVGGDSGMDGRSLSDDPDQAQRLWGKVVRTQGVGLGCTLIRRHVLEAIDFERRGRASNDWFFAIDVRAAGFSQVSDLSVVCGHIQGDQVVWPDPAAPGLARFESTVTIYRDPTA